MLQDLLTFGKRQSHVRTVKFQTIQVPHHFSVSGNQVKVHVAVVVGENGLMFLGKETQYIDLGRLDLVVDQ